MLAHQSLRAAEAVLETQDLGDSRRLDLVKSQDVV